MSFLSVRKIGIPSSKVDIIVFITDDPNATEVVKISEGQLFFVREETIRSERECMCAYHGCNSAVNDTEISS